MKHLLALLSLVSLLCATDTARAQTTAAQTTAVLTPIQFNDHLTDITDSLYVRGQAWGEQFNEVHKTRGYAALRPARESMERFVSNSIARLKAMQDVKDSKALRTAMISYLEFERRMISEAFKPLEALSASSTREEMQAAFSRLKSVTEAESAELQKVVAAQEAYAKANGFTIAAAEEEEE